MLNVDKRTGVITTVSGDTLEFTQDKLKINRNGEIYLITVERMVGGVEVVLYNDLVLQGEVESKVEDTINFTKSTLENMGLKVTVV